MVALIKEEQGWWQTYNIASLAVAPLIITLSKINKGFEMYKSRKGSLLLMYLAVMVSILSILTVKAEGDIEMCKWEISNHLIIMKLLLSRVYLPNICCFICMI